MREGKIDAKAARLLDAKPGEVVETFSNNTVMRIPSASTPEEDRKLLRETGLKFVEEYIRNGGNKGRAR